MKKLLLSIFILISIPLVMNAQTSDMKTERTLVIRWQHAVCKNENPCERCVNTPLEIQQAYENLRESLAGLGIIVTMEEKKIKQHDDHIYINDHDIIDLLKGERTKTECANCFDEKGNPRTCNSLKLGDKTFEVIPAELIMKAGLMAASELITATPEPPCGEKKTPCKGCPYSE
jgi:hypothetical protein